MEYPLSFIKHGFGQDVWIFFHGFGQDRSVYESWMSEFDPELYTCILVDLYFHGDSKYPNQPLDQSAWKSAFLDLLDQHHIERFTLVGFSLGARFAFFTLRLFKDRVNQLLLLGPDGFFQSNYYKIAVSPVGNHLFKYFMLHPRRLRQLIHLIEKLRITPSTSIRFAKKELSTKTKRKMVYQSWTYFKSIQSKLSDVLQIIEKENIGTTVVLGQHDQVTPERRIAPKLDHLSQARIIRIPGKHHQLIPNFQSYLRSFLQGDNL